MSDQAITPGEYRPFLNLHVIWHPDLAGPDVSGRDVAEHLFRTFSRDPERPMSPALGIPIYFHTSTSQARIPAPVDLDRAYHTVIVVLVNASLVVNEEWVGYLRDLAAEVDRRNGNAHGGQARRHLLLPVHLFPTEGQLDLGNLQGINLDATKSGWQTELRLRLAAEMCRLMQNRPRVGDAVGALSAEPPQLFISHAKRDGAGQAGEIKRLIENTPALDTFFDRVSIAAGHDFTQEIIEQIKRSAVLAWQSDEYAARPWCNIELITAKEFLRPVVVVLGLKAGEERSFPYLGNVRTIVATEDNSTEIIAAVVREYVRKLYAEGQFQALQWAGLVPPTRLRLFRPPEPIDAAQLQHKAETGDPVPPPEAVPPPAEATTGSPRAAASAEGVTAGVASDVDSGGRQWVLYPDPPLGTAESQVLARLFPAVRFTTPATADGSVLSKMKVALSISESDDLAAFGQSDVHLLSAMVEIARHALSRRAVIAYGGDLRGRDQGGFTGQLFELVRVYRDLGREPLWRIRNFLAHHVAAELTVARESTLLDVATLAKVPAPPDVVAMLNVSNAPPRPIPDDTAENRYARARCLSAMREAMTHEVHARVVLGGRVSGHQGKYPGILEEAHLTLLAKKPLYLVGGFGGCAKLLADVVAGRSRPAQLTRAYQVAHPRTRKHQDAQGAQAVEVVPFEALEQMYVSRQPGNGPIDYEALVDDFVKAGPGGLNNGLTDAENRELFDTPDLDRIISLVMRGLGRVHG